MSGTYGALGLAQTSRASFSENNHTANPVVEAPGSHHREELHVRRGALIVRSRKDSPYGVSSYGVSSYGVSPYGVSALVCGVRDQTQGLAMLDKHSPMEGHPTSNFGLFMIFIAVRIFRRATDCLHRSSLDRILESLGCFVLK